MYEKWQFLLINNSKECDDLFRVGSFFFWCWGWLGVGRTEGERRKERRGEDEEEKLCPLATTHTHTHSHTRTLSIYKLIQWTQVVVHSLPTSSLLPPWHSPWPAPVPTGACPPHPPPPSLHSSKPNSQYSQSSPNCSQSPWPRPAHRHLTGFQR